MNKVVYASAFDLLENPKKAADLQFRSDLIIVLEKVFEKNDWSQKEIAKALEISQPRASELINGKIHLFSSEKLLGFLAKLNIRFRPYMNENGKIEIRVTQP